MSRMERRKQRAQQLSIEKARKLGKAFERQAKLEKWIIIGCLVSFLGCSVASLIMGEPLVIVGSLLVGVSIFVLCGGVDVSDLVFLIWWDIGKK